MGNMCVESPTYRGGKENKGGRLITRHFHKPCVSIRQRVPRARACIVSKTHTLHSTLQCTYMCTYIPSVS